jgi:hypothetical protein
MVSLSLVTGLLGGAGVAGVWVICFLLNLMITTSSHKEAMEAKDAVIQDKEKQIAEWKGVAELERQRAEASDRRANAATEAANTSNLLLAGIRREITSSETPH